jgi:hypothetical protein
VWERRREELGEGRDAPGVLGGAFIGAVVEGSGWGGGAPERGGRSNGGVNG